MVFLHNCNLRLEQLLDSIAKALHVEKQDMIILYGPPYKHLDRRKNVATELVRYSINPKAFHSIAQSH